MLAARVPTAISRQDLSRLDGTPTRRRSERDRGWDDLWDREVVAYAAVSFLYACGQALYDIFQSQQAKHATGALLERWALGGGGYAEAYAYAMLVSAYAFAKAVSSPYVGDLSDRFGRRPVLVATLVCTGWALLWCGRAESFAAVLACRLLTGCVANGGLLTARATDMAATHLQRTRLFALFTTSWAAARVAAAALVPFMGFDMRRACAVACGCEAAAAGIAFLAFSDYVDPRRLEKRRRKKERKAEEQGEDGERLSLRSLARTVLSERLAYALFVTAMLTPRVDAASFVWRKFGEGPEAVGVLKALEAVAVVLVSLTPWAAKLEVRFGGAGAAVVAAALVAAGWLGIAAAPTMSVLYVLVFVRACCAALYDPAARSLCFQRATSLRGPKTGSLVGLQQSLKGATQVFGSWLGAYVTSLSVTLPLFASAAASLANAAVIALECADDVFDAEAAARHKKDDDAPQPRRATPPASPRTPPHAADVVVAEPVAGPPPRRPSFKATPLPRIPSGRFLGLPVEAEAFPLTATFSETGARGTRCRLLCAGPTHAAALGDDASEDPDATDLSRASVGDVAAWLKGRGQAFAAERAKDAGVDGTALQIGTADELHDALGGDVSRLVCRSILLAARSPSSHALHEGTDSKEGRRRSTSSEAMAPGALAGLSPEGRRRALSLRCTDAPALVVVAPERAALQTALLAFRPKPLPATSSPPRLAFGRDGSAPRFVAHDAARSAEASAARELRLEYGAVDFGGCDDGDVSAAAPDAKTLARNAYALLCFVRARAERDVAVVADAVVLEALVNATRAPGDAMTLDPEKVHDLRLTFEERAERSAEEPEGW